MTIRLSIEDWENTLHQLVSIATEINQAHNSQGPKVVISKTKLYMEDPVAKTILRHLPDYQECLNSPATGMCLLRSEGKPGTTLKLTVEAVKLLRSYDLLVKLLSKVATRHDAVNMDSFSAWLNHFRSAFERNVIVAYAEG